MCAYAADAVAARLAREAHNAESSGQTVRAYLLYAEAAARDPSNPTYRANRDSLAPAATLLTKAHIETAEVTADIRAADRVAESERPGKPPPLDYLTDADWKQSPELDPLPHVHANAS